MSEPLPRVDPQPKPPPQNWRKIAIEAFAHPKAHRVREALANTLGVTPESLKQLGVGFLEDFATFPCKSATGDVVGIVRRYPDGAKYSMEGSSNGGLFYIPGWSLNPGPVLIVEGPTDVAACVSAGLCAIGRPNNTGGGPMIKVMLQARAAGRKVFVVGERDEKPEKRGKFTLCPDDCNGCNHCFPGLYGAKRVAGQLGCQWVMPPEGFKDFRAYWKSGGVWTEFIRSM